MTPSRFESKETIHTALAPQEMTVWDLIKRVYLMKRPRNILNVIPIIIDKLNFQKSESVFLAVFLTHRFYIVFISCFTHININAPVSQPQAASYSYFFGEFGFIILQCIFVCDMLYARSRIAEKKGLSHAS